MGQVAAALRCRFQSIVCIIAESHLAITPLLVAVTAVGTFLSVRAARRSEYERFAAAVGIAVFIGFLALYLLTITIRGEWSAFFCCARDHSRCRRNQGGFRSQVISGMFMALAFAVVAEAFL